MWPSTQHATPVRIVGATLVVARAGDDGETGTGHARLAGRDKPVPYGPCSLRVRAALPAEAQVFFVHAVH